MQPYRSLRAPPTIHCETLHGFLRAQGVVVKQTIPIMALTRGYLSD
jgi:hypothetical protein